MTDMQKTNRSEFEEWAMDKVINLKKDEIDGEYFWEDIQFAWESWQAAIDEARDRLTLNWDIWTNPDTMRVVLATDGESMYVATYTKDDDWQDAYSGEPIEYITYWAEMPALPQV